MQEKTTLPDAVKLSPAVVAFLATLDTIEAVLEASEGDWDFSLGSLFSRVVDRAEATRDWAGEALRRSDPGLWAMVDEYRFGDDARAWRQAFEYAAEHYEPALAEQESAR